VESALPMLGEDYVRAFLVSAGAAMLRAGRAEEAATLLRRVLAVGGDAAKGRAIIGALAQQYGAPELNELLSGDGAHAVIVSGRWQ
jgi:hypothetical protein